ncbi:hypothetical protein BDM02DRAFT_1758913 [Thelephora ganbajun]|uniref:Uncharacterized protein n=1 Tax=Thelephora ganbajun TaxID=370292 RepID=A0ACB6Z016_THEGA|nr:hypothetical protein BDM02DRAFT_1758913 [Thelephora ganbajun]
MSEDDLAGLTAKPLDSIYLSGLLDNISTAQDHLAGNDGTPLLPSLLLPNTVWTPQEKNAFFHALSVYSRFRPDLISHEIKTKSVPEVCNYLSVLQLAASQQETTVPYSQWRQSLPIAVEVSSEWVAMEEETALGVIMQEQDWQRELIAGQRRTELKLLKKAYKVESQGAGPSRPKAELKRDIADTNLRDRQKDFCGSLGSLELTAIDTILREATDSSGSNHIKQSTSVLHTSALQHSAGHAARLEATQTLPFSAAKVANTRNPLNSVQRRSNNSGELSQSSTTKPFQTSSPKQDSTVHLAGLSPVSRRRYQKRLYMRRKRASMSGVTGVDDSLERLKPGRKRVKRSPSPEGGTLYDLELSTSVDRDVEDKESATSVYGTDGFRITQKRYPRAKRTAIDELQDLGLTADELRGLGVDVLNPKGIARMLGLWNKLSGDDSDHGSRISIETIQLLNVHVVWFVKNLVYRAITLREQERALKSETRVWKLSGKAVGGQPNNRVCPHVIFPLISFVIGSHTRAYRKSCFHGGLQRTQ